MGDFLKSFVQTRSLDTRSWRSIKKMSAIHVGSNGSFSLSSHPRSGLDVCMKVSELWATSSSPQICRCCTCVGLGCSGLFLLLVYLLWDCIACVLCSSVAPSAEHGADSEHFCPKSILSLSTGKGQ